MMLSSKFAASQRGMGVIVLLMVTAIVTALLCASVLYFGTNLENIRFKTEMAQERKQLENELKIVFSNPVVCTNQLNISGSNFTVGNFLRPDTNYGSLLKIRTLQIADSVVQANGSIGANFIIEASHRYNQNLKQRVRVKALYKLTGATVSTCSIGVDPQAACESMGLAWIDAGADSRCGVCENLGWAWSAQDKTCAVGG